MAVTDWTDWLLVAKLAQECKSIFVMYFLLLAFGAAPSKDRWLATAGVLAVAGILFFLRFL